MSSKRPEDSFLISFSDLFSILKRSKIKILSLALAFSFLGVLYALMQPIFYEAEGTFREKGVRQSTLGPPSIIQFLSGGNSSVNGESEAASLMVSRKILKNVIEKLNLQGRIESKKERETRWKMMQHNLHLVFGSWKNYPWPVLEDRFCPLKIGALEYKGEVPLLFLIDLQEGGDYQVTEVFSQKSLGVGTLGKSFSFNELSFTLEPAPFQQIRPQSFYFSLSSLATTTEQLCQSLTVEPSKLDKSLLMIKYKNRDRHLASAIVNEIMESYQSYLKNSHAEMALKQLDYLKERRDQLMQNLTDVMQKHAHFLSHDLYSSGFIESHKETDFLAKSLHEYKQKLLDNEVEIKRLAAIQPGQFAHYERYSLNEGDPAIINAILSEIRSLKQQRDTLEIELQKKSFHHGINLQELFEEQLNELKEVQQSLVELREIKEQFQQKGVIEMTSFKLFDNPHFLLKGWLNRLEAAKKQNSENAKEIQENFQFYLSNLERLFSVHERILHERLTHHQNPSEEYQGITLDVATDLYRDYSKQQIQMENTIRQNLFFIHQIENPYFEISSLSAGLSDPVSSEMIQKSSQLILNLRDQNNQSAKEQDRIKEELQLQRTFLTLHLEQMIQLMQLNKKVLDEKIFALQNVSLELIHQRISLLEKNLQEYLHSRLQNLEQERALIKRQLENIHLEMAQIPQKWVSEQLTTQEVATSHLIVEEIAKLVETKNISHNLEVIQSSPVDLSLPPLHPLVPKIGLWAVLGLFLGGCFGSCLALGSSLKDGVKASPHYLKQMGGHVSGVLTSPLFSSKTNQLKESNLETLRRIQFYFDSFQEKLLLLIEGKGPHYAPFLAKLYKKKGCRILTIHFSLMSSSPCLFKYLQGEIEKLSIQKGEFGDEVFAGIADIFPVELLASPLFQKLIEEWKREYDVILAISCTLPCQIESEILTSLFPLVAISLSDEKREDLNFYFHFLQNHPNHHLTFILVNASFG